MIFSAAIKDSDWTLWTNNETIVIVISYYFEFIGMGERGGFPHIGFGPQSNLLIKYICDILGQVKLLHLIQEKKLSWNDQCNYSLI